MNMQGLVQEDTMSTEEEDYQEGLEHEEGKYSLIP